MRQKKVVKRSTNNDKPRRTATVAAKPAAAKSVGAGTKVPVAKVPVAKVPVAKVPVAKAAASLAAKPMANTAAAKPMANTAAAKPMANTAAAKPPGGPARPANSNLKAVPTRPAPAPVAKPTLAPAAAPKPAAKPANGKSMKLEFGPNDYVVYPTHGVGRIVKVERQEISGHTLDLFVIEFDKDKMTLRVPIAKVNAVGMRRLSTPQKMKNALDTLKGRARIKRAMWSRRAQEYEAKINSGDPISIAEVVRDLHRNAGQPDQSYSERQIYEAALDRLARELAAVEKIDEETAARRLEKVLRAA